MTTPRRDPASTDGGRPIAPEAVPEPRPDRFAVSPGIGPIPGIYAPRSPGQASVAALARRTVAPAGRLAHGWVYGLRQRVSSRSRA